MHVLAFLLGPSTVLLHYMYSAGLQQSPDRGCSYSLSGLVEQLIVELPARGVCSVVRCAHFADAKFQLHAWRTRLMMVSRAQALARGGLLQQFRLTASCRSARRFNGFGALLICASCTFITVWMLHRGNIARFSSQ
jgi:hypothetical protein